MIGIQADGSAMYTISALWSYAREQCDVTTIVCDNGSYAILEHELSRVGRRATASGPRSCSTWAARTWTSSRWPPGWACRPPATTAEDLADQLQALAEPGPHLIVAVPRRRGESTFA